MDNSGEETQIIYSGWEVSTIQRAEIDEGIEKRNTAKMPKVPENIIQKQQEDLKVLLRKYKKVFFRKLSKDWDYRGHKA